MDIIVLLVISSFVATLLVKAMVTLLSDIFKIAPGHSNGTEQLDPFVMESTLNRGSMLLRGIANDRLPFEHVVSRSLRITADGNEMGPQLLPGARITLYPLPDTEIGSLVVGAGLRVAKGDINAKGHVSAGGSIKVKGKARARNFESSDSMKIRGSVTSTGSLYSAGRLDIGRDAIFRSAKAGTSLNIHGSKVDKLDTRSDESSAFSEPSDVSEASQ